MSIYGPNFSSESMDGDVVSSEPKTLSSSGFVNRHDMAIYQTIFNLFYFGCLATINLFLNFQ